MNKTIAAFLSLLNLNREAVNKNEFNHKTL